jgi:hypothetical protein
MLSLLTIPAALLAQQTTAAPPYAWRPFLSPMPVWDYWFWLLLPLSIGVAIVYKTTKCYEPRQVPREAALLSLWIVLGLVAAAIGIGIAVRYA